MSDTFLTRDEVAELSGRKTKRKQVEHLRTLGLPFWENAAGWPMVPRSAIDGKASTVAKQKKAWIPPGLREDYRPS